MHINVTSPDVIYFYSYKMTDELIKTENPVIDEIVKRIYEMLMDEVLKYNEILDLMVSINFTGRLYNTILEAYIGDSYVPRITPKSKPPICQRLYTLIKENLNNDPIFRNEYKALIIKYLNKKLTKARDTLCNSEPYITETVNNKNNCTYCYKYRSTLKGPFMEILVLMTNKEDKYANTKFELKSADYIISLYKQLYFPGAYYHQDTNGIYFSLYIEHSPQVCRTFPKIESR